MNNMKKQFNNQSLQLLDWFFSTRINTEYGDEVYGGDILEFDKAIKDNSVILITTQKWVKSANDPYVMINFIDKVMGPVDLFTTLMDIIALEELNSLCECTIDFCGGNELTISFRDDVDDDHFDIECVILYDKNNKLHNHEGWKFEI